LNGRKFATWLRKAFYDSEGRVPSSEAVSSAVATLEGIACFEGEAHELHNRVARSEEALYYDLADRERRTVVITRDGWHCTSSETPTFRRYAHQLAQVEPQPHGDAWDIFRFLNVRRDDQLLALAWLVTAFVPDIPHPVQNFHGEKGAGKSLGQRVLRELIDPSAAPSLTFPRDVAEMAQQLAHNYAPVYDNLDGLPPWLSDCLCRAVTGDGFSKRELYTNDDDVIFAYRRVIMLNGINVAPRRPDLLDRSILFRLERIARDRRFDERTFWSDFHNAKPRILGGIFDALSRALRLYDSIQVANLERMADFTRWGAAVAEALGRSKAEFLDAYSVNIGVQNREALEGDLIGNSILKLMDGREVWTGTPTSLLIALEEAALKARLIQKTVSGKVDARGWPGAPHILSRRLNLIRSNLAEVGLIIKESRDAERLLEIARVDESESSVGSVGYDDEQPGLHGDPDGTDATDGTSGEPHKVYI
jgi:hypothetical protein